MHHHFRSSPDAQPALSEESRRLFSRTAELLHRLTDAYQELDIVLRDSGRSMEEWVLIARQTGGRQGDWMAAQLVAVARNRERVEHLRRTEPSRSASHNRIPAMRLVRRV